MKTLIAYFSHAGQNYVSGDIIDLPRGNAEVLAEFAAEATGGDLFRIERVEPYPADYHRCTDEAAREKDDAARPILARDVDIDPYDQVILVYPNWWGTMPMPVYSFLEAHDWTGKPIRPLCTHEGSGLSRTPADIARACPGADVRPGLAVLGSTAAQARSQIRSWLA